MSGRARSIHQNVIVLLAASLGVGCEQQMAEQPSYRPLQPRPFFADGRASRPPVAGTVARGQLPDDDPLVNGRIDPDAADPVKEYAAAFPFPLTEEILSRGRERYTIFCAVCHDPLGTGKGKIVERGYTAPPSYHTDLSRGLELRGVKVPLREAPVGYYFEVITQGYGAMASYAAQIPPRDRWAVVAYVRALQLSQNARLADLPSAERQAALDALKTTAEGRP